MRRRLLSAIGLLLTGCSNVAIHSIPKSPLAALPAEADVTPTATDDLPSLASLYAPFFPVGIAITPGQVMLGGNSFIEKQFSVLVAENAMKPESMNRAGAGEYDFKAADALADFAKKAGIKLRGHTLVWHQQAADWMFRGNGPAGVATRDELVSRMRTYIHDVVGHFKGRVYCWDVVNEAFVPDEPTVPQVDGWRNSHWYRIIGPEFIALAFKFAHEADPDALLFYNDYNSENPRKHALIMTLIRDLQGQGIPIHGIGHQSHYTIKHPASFRSLETAILEIASLGLTNHITELDISLSPNPWSTPVEEVTLELQELQAQRYHDFFAMCLRQQKNVSAVLMWGLNDGVSWLLNWPRERLDAPLLFDAEMKAKPAFWAVVNLAARARHLR